MTIYDIAKEAGVSPSSVSRVLNNKPGVNEESRRVVLQLLEQYDFVPNAIARGLVNRASKTVGILISDLRVSHHVDGVYYVQKELSEYGYCSIIMNTGNETQDKVQALRELEQRQVDGIVLMGAVFQCDEVRDVIAQHFKRTPMVIVNGSIDLENVCGIVSNETEATYECAEVLHDRGRKNIVFICDDGRNPSVEAKKRGFEKAAREIGFDNAVTVDAENSYEGGFAASEDLIQSGKSFDAILCSADIIAAGAIHSLKKNGLKVPGDVAVIGMNNSSYSKVCYPTITSLDTKRNEASVIAAKNLIEIMNGKKVPHITELKPEIIFRESI